MEIKTQYSTNDEVWFLYENEVQKDKVLKTLVEVTGESIIINYVLDKERYMHGGYSRIMLSQDKVFSTRKELIRSL